MSKRFDIHEWQAKQKNLNEGEGSTLSLSKKDMEKLHKDGKIEIDGHKILYKVEEDLDEMNTLGSAGAGTYIKKGNSGAYATPYAFKKTEKDD